MIEIRPAAERGHADHGWLDTWHSFSFADYYDPAHMGWGPLRVINDDRIAAGTGFGTHGHRDMEIVTVVLEGALQHRDSLGNGEVIRPGEVQRMTAGTGVRHSEFNPSEAEPTWLLQIWIEPAERGLSPGYEQKAVSATETPGRWRLLASPDGREGSVTIHQDARLLGLVLPAEELADLPLADGRLGYVHVIRGRVRVNGVALGPGDGARIADESVLACVAETDAELICFDLPR